MTTTPNVHQRLHAAMGEVKYVQKERKQGMRYTIVSHDAVTALVRPALIQQGIVYYPVEMSAEQVGNRTQVLLKVRFANIDEPADFIDVPGLGYGVDDQDKGPGKAISYAVKYCLLKALGLETGDDPDLEDKPHKPEPTQRPTASAAPPVTDHGPKAPPPSDDWKIVAADIVKAVKACQGNRDVDILMSDFTKQLQGMHKHAPDLYAAVGAEVKGHRATFNVRAG